MNPLKHKMANEWMRQEDASPEEALNTWDTMEAEFKANRAMSQEPRTMAQGGGVIGKPGGLVEPGVMYYAKWVKTGPGTSKRITAPEKHIQKLEYRNKAGDITTKYKGIVPRYHKSIRTKPSDSLAKIKKEVEKIKKANPIKAKVSGLDSPRVKPALDRFSDALLNAHAKDDLQYIMEKTKTNPAGKLTTLDIHNIYHYTSREDNMQYLSKKSGLSVDEIFDLLDDKEAYSDLEGRTKAAHIASITRDPTGGEATIRQKFYAKAEDWLTKNAERYDDPEKFKKAFNRTFGKNNILAKDLKRSGKGAYSFFVPFSNEFKREFFGTGLGMVHGGRKSRLKAPVTDPKKLANIFYTPSQLDEVFKTTMYNLNPAVRNQITEEFKKIIPETKVGSKEQYQIYRNLKESEVLKKFGLDRKIKGPISRLIYKELGEKLYDDISVFRKPFLGTTNLIRVLKD